MRGQHSTVARIQFSTTCHSSLTTTGVVRQKQSSWKGRLTVSHTAWKGLRRRESGPHLRPRSLREGERDLLLPRSSRWLRPEDERLLSPCCRPLISVGAGRGGETCRTLHATLWRRSLGAGLETYHPLWEGFPRGERTITKPEGRNQLSCVTLLRLV